MPKRVEQDEEMTFGDGEYDTTSYSWKAFQSYEHYLDALKPKLEKLRAFATDYPDWLDVGQNKEFEKIQDIWQKRKNGTKSSPKKILAFIGLVRPEEVTGLCERMDRLARTFAISHTLMTKDRDRKAILDNGPTAASPSPSKPPVLSNSEMAARCASWGREFERVQNAVDMVEWVPSNPSQYLTADWMTDVPKEWMPEAESCRDIVLTDPASNRSVTFRVELTGSGPSGAFGKIFSVDLHGTDHQGNTKVAIKQPIFHLYRKTDNIVKRFVREMKTFRSLGDHDNIVPIYGGFWLEGVPYAVFGWGSHGTLDEYVANRSKTSHRIRLLKEAASGLAYMHSRDFIHCDITPRNIIVSPQETAWIIDFGLSKGPTMSTSSATVREMGTWMFKAPEVLEKVDDDDDAEDYEQDSEGNYDIMGRKSRDKKTDVYAFGITMFEILSLKNAFRISYISSQSAFEKQRDTIKKQVKTGKLRPGPFPQESPNGESWAFAETLATRCWDQDRDKRPEMDEVVQVLAASGLN